MAAPSSSGTGGPGSPTATAPTRNDDAAIRRARLGRRIGIAILAMLVAAGLSGMLGVTTRAVEARGEGLTLRVEYPAVSRGGLAIAWSATVTRAAGFDGPIVLRSSGDYFELFDDNALEPDPLRSTADGETVTWTFSPPEGDTFAVSLDARVEPARQWGTGGRTEVLLAGEPVASVTYSTLVIP